MWSRLIRSGPFEEAEIEKGRQHGRQIAAGCEQPRHREPNSAPDPAGRPAGHPGGTPGHEDGGGLPKHPGESSAGPVSVIPSRATIPSLPTILTSRGALGLQRASPRLRGGPRRQGGPRHCPADAGGRDPLRRLQLL